MDLGWTREKERERGSPGGEFVKRERRERSFSRRGCGEAGGLLSLRD